MPNIDFWKEKNILNLSKGNFPIKSKLFGELNTDKSRIHEHLKYFKIYLAVFNSFLTKKKIHMTQCQAWINFHFLSALSFPLKGLKPFFNFKRKVYQMYSELNH